MAGEKHGSWELSDAFWSRVEPLVPPRKKDPWGRGRPAVAARRVFAGILYVLRTGCQWKAVPADRFAPGSTIHRRFQEWVVAGFFLALWQAGLVEYDEMEGIAWSWQSLDGAMVKAPLGGTETGPNPTDRGKKRRQAQHACRRAWRPAVARRDRSQSA